MRRLSVLFCLCLLFAALPRPGVCGEVLVSSSTLPPLHEPDAALGARGYSIDLLEMLFKDAGMHLDRKTILFPPWARVLNSVATTPGTLLVGVARTAAREPDYCWVGPFATLKLGLIARKDRALRVHGDEDIRKLSIAVVKDSGPMLILRDEHGLAVDAMELVVSDANQFRMLRAGRVDAVTHASLSAPLVLRTLGDDPARYEMIHVLRSVDLYYVLNPADAALAERLQHALDKLADRDCGRFLGVLLRTYLSGDPIDVAQ